MLDWAWVINFCRELSSIEKMRFHEIFVCQYHGSLVALPQPFGETLFVCLGTCDNAILQAHYSPLVCIFRSWLKMQAAPAKSLHKLFLRRLF